MKPKVSVILPVFNCEQYMEKCLDSILAQSYKNFELIIVNDGSIDNTEKIICKYKEVDRRIISFTQENSGPSEARNLGLKNSLGDYIIFIDSDDTVEENYFSTLVANMEHENVDFVCCGYTEFTINGVTKHIDFNFNENITRDNVMELICTGTGGVLWSKIFKKDIIKKFNLQMDKEIFMSEDLIFVLQYTSFCNSFKSVKEYLYNYNRMNENSISSKISMEYLSNYELVWEKIEDILMASILDESKVNFLISKLVQNTFLNLMESQSQEIKKIGIFKAVSNSRFLLSNPFLQKYKNDFYTNNYFYKPFLFLLKRRYVYASITYGVFLNKIRILKKKYKKVKWNEKKITIRY
jgi:glycosyltransferase involved in cell wall biosynthesis